MQYQTSPQLTQTHTSHDTNEVTLIGTVHTEPSPTGDFHLSVKRLSGMADIIPITLSEEANTFSPPVTQGATVEIRGHFHSYNKIVGDRSKLMLTVYAREILETDDQTAANPNNIEMTGYICKAPIYRTTPFNREIADLLIAVNRTVNKSEYIPAIAWGRNARFAKNLLIGERVHISGRIQSREYQKRFDDGTIETRTAYEVSVCNLMRAES